MARYQNVKKIYNLLENFHFDPDLSTYKNTLIQSAELNNYPVLNNQYVELFDISSRRIIFLSDNFTDIFECELENVTLELIFNQVVADDRNIVINASIYALEVFYKHPEINSLETTFEIDFRLQKFDGSIIRMLKRSSIYKRDKMGYPILLLSLYLDISRFKKNELVEVVAEGPHKHFFNFLRKEKNKHKNGNFTEKEIQILKKLADGKCCKIIADEMNIKLCTVNSHCINMLRKSNQNKINGVIAIAINNGYLK
jgi:DNA-binding CsgD family transcriptional regulator